MAFLSQTLLDRLIDVARREPGRAAVIELAEASGRRGVTYGQVASRAVGVADVVRGNVRAGDVVLMSLRNSGAFHAAFFGLLAAGARAYCLGPDAPPGMVETVLKRTGAVGAIACDAVLDAIPAGVPLRFRVRAADVEALPGDRAVTPVATPAAAGLVLQSSGSTGLPKDVFRSARSLDAVGYACAASIGIRPVDRVLSCLPLAHSYGIEHGLLAPAWAGATVHLCHGFDLPAVLHELASQPVNILPGVPVIFETLGQRLDRRPAALRRAYSAGAPLPDRVREEAEARLGLRVSQLYGATEVGSVLYSDPDLPGYAARSVGRPMPGVSLLVLDTDKPDPRDPRSPGEQGQVAIRAESMLTEYLGGHPVPLADGFFLTGDLGSLDGHGNLTITGRMSMLVDVGGRKVNPVEVEEVLMSFPGVGTAVVLPEPVSQTVSRLRAILVPSAGAVLNEEVIAALRRHARERLPGYKVPRTYEVRPSVPRTASGKVLRQELR